MTPPALDIERDWERFKIQHLVPDGAQGIWRVHHFNIAPKSRDAEVLRAKVQGRYPGTGRFACLAYLDLDNALNRRGWTPMMSDTRPEIVEHAPILEQLTDPATRRVLIHGLGLGVVVNAALAQPHIEHVDVVEISPDVIDLVGPVYQHDPRLTIHLGDAFTHRWPRGTRWDAGWHDIWPTITENNLPDMRRLHDRYRKRVTWQESWARDQCTRDHQNREKVTRLLGELTECAQLMVCGGHSQDLEKIFAAISRDTGNLFPQSETEWMQ